jgi:SPP1 family predicted phage head-tail adaptor
MRAGLLRHRVTIQQATTTTNERGAKVPGWEDVATVWADVRTPTGRERTANETTVATLTHVVTVRYRRDVTAAHRIKWDERVLSLLATPDPDNRRRMLVCQCQEITGDGEVV